ncbi:BBF_collapsed_G0017100.mRNA.1.CDS.1 [Saccharomyces cerevisiae]|nr:BBF_collapsed_G0017100.mRNA.1.CDS.1 [Saccharomyces cerevisiae]
MPLFVALHVVLEQLICWRVRYSEGLVFTSTHDSKKEQNGQFINAMKNCYNQKKRKPDGFESSGTQKSVENMLKCVKNGGTVK